ENELKQKAREENLKRSEDLSTILNPLEPGSLHVLTQTRQELTGIFMRMGFTVKDGPHIEHERYNFDALNIPEDHPARAMQDTFFIEGHEHLVLRTHTSPVQIRSMLNTPPPIRIAAPGAVFRCDDDATHSPMFHQVEGLYIDRGVNLADLKATLLAFVREYY